MKKLYYSIATITAFLSFSLFIDMNSFKESPDVEIQHIDMSEFPVYINVKKGEN